MKHIIFGTLGGTVAVLFAVMLLAIFSKNVRQEELDTSLAEAMKSVMQNRDGNAGCSEPVSNKPDYAAELVQKLSVQLNSDSDITVRIFCADEEKGILSAEAIETFHYPTGKKGEVHSMRTIIADREEMETLEKYMVTFFLTKEDMQQNKHCYKQMCIQEKDRLIQPKAPQTAVIGRHFKEWRDSQDYLADFSQPAEQDMSYYAVFE